jgi:hypothetical protein
MFQVALRQRFSLKLSRVLGFVVTFFIGIVVEFSQYFGIPLFGSTYDPLDIMMYFLEPLVVCFLIL